MPSPIILKFTPQRQDTFLSTLAETGDADRACDACEVPWRVVFIERAENAAFRARWADVVAAAFDKRAERRA